MASRRAAKDPAVRVELTARHEQVLALIAAGKTNGEIAEALGLTLDGAKWHVREILSRLGAETREEAVERWRKRQSGRRRRPWAWFGCPAAAVIGAVGVVVAGAVLVVAVASRSSEEPQPGQFDSLTGATAAGLPAPTRGAPANLDSGVARLIQGAGVPLELVTWVDQTVVDKRYEVRLHGAYADTTRTVIFATARPIDADAPGVSPVLWLAELRDSHGKTYSEKSGPGVGFSEDHASHGAKVFEAVGERDRVQPLELRFSALASEQGWRVEGEWVFGFDVMVRSSPVSKAALPRVLSDGDLEYEVVGIELSADVVTIEWVTSGADPAVSGVPRFDAGPPVTLLRHDGTIGVQSATGTWEPPVAGHGTRFAWTLVTYGPGDYVVVFGDPATSTARFPLTVP